MIGTQERKEVELKKKRECAYIAIGCTFGCLAVASIVIVLVLTLGCKDRALRDELNLQNGLISRHFSRQQITPRANLADNPVMSQLLYMEEQSLQWSECEFDTYWNEEGKVSLS